MKPGNAQRKNWNVEIVVVKVTIEMGAFGMPSLMQHVAIIGIRFVAPIAVDSGTRCVLEKHAGRIHLRRRRLILRPFPGRDPVRKQAQSIIEKLVTIDGMTSGRVGADDQTKVFQNVQILLW